MQKFQVGDTVRIRDWDDMVDEFGGGGNGSIYCNGTFTVKMRYLCGLEFQISSLEKVRHFAFTNRDGYIVHLEPKEKLKMPVNHRIPIITNDMIELVRSQKEFVCVNTTAIDDFIM